jgi:hypothetical protein
MQRHFMQASVHFGGIGGHHVTDRAWASAIFVSKCRISGARLNMLQIWYQLLFQPPPGANAPPLLNQGGEP